MLLLNCNEIYRKSKSVSKCNFDRPNSKLYALCNLISRRGLVKS